MIRIITDSGCDLKEMNGLSVVPFTVTADGIDYKDEIHDGKSPIVDVYEKSEKTSTACPGPNLWYEAANGADNVIMMPTTKEISGSYNAANIASQMLEEDGVKSVVIDTMMVSAGLNLMVRKAVEMAANNLPFDEIHEAVNAMQVKMNFLLFSINNLVKNGRVPKIAGMALNALKLSVIGEDKDGAFGFVCKSKGEKKSVSAIIDEMKKNGFCSKFGHVEITHCLNRNLADELARKIKDTFGEVSVFISPASGLCSYYAERGGILVGYQTQCN